MTSLQKEQSIVICLTVCDWFDLSPSCIIDRDRREKVVVARHFACLLMEELLGMALQDIGLVIQRVERHTPRNSIRHAYDLIETDPAMRKALEGIEKECRRRLNMPEKKVVDSVSQQV